MAAQPFPQGERASVSAAKLAYFEGDFERCLEICAAIHVRSLPTASEVALLTARAYLRTGRAAEAEASITASAPTHTSLDASLTAQMLLGTARIRQADADGGLALLAAAAERAAAGAAHFAIRSEIAFSTALGHWAKRDIDTAERFLIQVDRRADIIHARALELSAWCESARGNYRRSAEFFILTLLRLDTCRAQDRAITATAISTLSILGAELFDREIMRVATHRARSMEWTSGLAVHRYLTVLYQALYAEMANDTVEAYELAMNARELAPSVAFDALAWTISASFARNAGEVFTAIVHARRARNLLTTLDLDELVGEERFSILAVAESCAHFDSESADRLFATYWGLTDADAMLALTGDPRLAAEETYVGGVIAEARGELDAAKRCYRKAFSEFERIGYVRRAVISAFAFLKLHDDPALRSYIAAALKSTANHVTRALARSADPLDAIQAHPLVAALPRAQREVVVLICQGKSNKEIAALRNVGEQTIKNMLTKHVFRAFGVANRAALVSTCLRGA